jgi:hypothetical protein
VAGISFGITVGFAALTLQILHASDPKDLYLPNLPFEFIPDKIQAKST